MSSNVTRVICSTCDKKPATQLCEFPVRGLTTSCSKPLCADCVKGNKEEDYIKLLKNLLSLSLPEDKCLTWRKISELYQNQKEHMDRFCYCSSHFEQFAEEYRQACK